MNTPFADSEVQMPKQFIVDNPLLSPQLRTPTATAHMISCGVEQKVEQKVEVQKQNKHTGSAGY